MGGEIMLNIADCLEEIVVDAVRRELKTPDRMIQDNPALELLSLGEIADRLAIVNTKLYDLKNEVMRRRHDTEFLAWQAREDVRLVEERARLKRTLSQKFEDEIKRAIETGKTSHNPETKRYE